MGFLRKLLGGQQTPTWPPAGPITYWPGDAWDGELTAVPFDATGHTVEVVGEGSYQGSLERLAEGRTVDGARRPDHMAILLPEPSNPYDSAAVRVILAPERPGERWGRIGYLLRKDAPAYRSVIDRLAAVGKIAACRAAIRGGWDRGGEDRGNFGVKLHLGTPADLDKELEADPDTLRPAWL